MRSQFILSLCGIVLAAALVVGGTTSAWFTDRSIPLENPALAAGTVDVEVTPLDPDEGVWDRGESKQFTWALENMGSEPAYVRARLSEWVEGQVDWAPAGTSAGAWTDPGDGWYYYTPVVRAGETVFLELVGSPARTGDEVAYIATLEAEAVQTSNNAGDLWPN